MNENSDRGILASVQKMTGTYNLDQIYLVTGTCSNIDEAAGTCDVEAVSGNATTTISGVKFQAAVGDGVDYVPADGSVVKVLFSKYTTPLIVQYSDIDKMIMAANEYEFDCDSIVFNKGTNDGLVKVAPLKTKLNNLESDLNNLKTLLSTMIAAMSAVTTGNVTHAELIAYFTPLLPYTAQVLIPTQQTEIEDTKFKH